MRSRKLQQTLLTAVALISVAWVSACGNDNPATPNIPVPVEPIARLNITYGFGVYVDGLESVSFRVSYSATGGQLTLFDLDLTEVDSGDVIEFDSTSSPRFNDFVSMLTNGDDDELYQAVKVVAADGGAMMGGGVVESVRLRDRIFNSSIPDLADTTISKIRVEFERSSVNAPGLDPSGDGKWVDIWVLGEILFF